MNDIIYYGEFYDGYVLSLGDNFDLAGCKKSDIAELKEARLLLIETTLVTHIDGNHCRCDIIPEYVILNDIVFAHGDFEKWGLEKAVKYRSKKHGASFFKRRFIIPAIEFFENVFTNRVTKKFIKAAISVAKDNECHTYVCGHIHVKKMYDKAHYGVRIIVLPRGRTELEI